MLGKSPSQTRAGGSKAEAAGVYLVQATARGAGDHLKAGRWRGEYCWYRAGDRGTIKCRARRLTELGGWSPGMAELQVGPSVYR